MAIPTPTQKPKVHQQYVFLQNGNGRLLPPSVTKPLSQSEVAFQRESSSVHGMFVSQDSTLTSVRRLVVLIPNLDVDESVIARRIWEVAFPSRLAVLLLSLYTNTNEESSARRRLITIAALVREPRIPVDIQLDFGYGWEKSLKTILGPEDVVVCHTEQYAGIWHKSLDRILAEAGIPVMTMAGFYPEIRKSISGVLRESVFWAVSLLILAGFFWLQVQFLHISEEWVKNVLLYLSVPLEVGLLWIWHNLLF